MQLNPKNFLLAIFTSFGLLMAQPGYATPKYNIIGLGSLNDNEWMPGRSAAYALNDFGQVVGTTETPDEKEHAFLWENGVMSDLGSLGGYSRAYGINDKGQIVGVSDISGKVNYTNMLNHISSEGTPHAFLWEDGAMLDLGAGEARAINNSGQIVGWSLNAGAVMWENGTMRELGTLGGRFSGAWAINDAGQVVGSSETSEGEYHAFLWEKGNMYDLGGWWAIGTGINNNGQAIVESSIAESFLWENGVISDISQPGYYSTVAWGINDVGQIVGTSGGGADLWDSGTWYDLNDLVSPGYAGLEIAFDINNYGQIVGVDSNSHAFLATPVPAPEPLSVFLLSAGFMGIGLKGFRKS